MVSLKWYGDVPDRYSLPFESVRECWGSLSLCVLPRDVSDHCTLVLKVGGVDWRQKPFCFNKQWIENVNFKRVVDKVWGSQSRSGWMEVVLKNKLKGLKIRLKEWSKMEYGGMDNIINLLMDDIVELDVKGEKEMLSNEEVKGRNLLFGELWKLLKSIDADLVQRFRSKRLKEGDVNFNFSHRRVKVRFNHNSTKALTVDDMWLQTLKAVKRAVVEYFDRHVAQNNWERPKLDEVVFARLTD